MVITSIAALKTVAGSDSFNFCNVLGYYNKGDGGGGNFFWDSSSTEPQDGGTVFQVSGTTTGRWKRLLGSNINIRWFGAKGDGSNDDAPSIRSAISFLRKIGGGVLDFPLATYYLDSVENPLPYESASLIIRIPNIPIYIKLQCKHIQGREQAP